MTDMDNACDEPTSLWVLFDRYQVDAKDGDLLAHARAKLATTLEYCARAVRRHKTDNRATIDFFDDFDCWVRDNTNFRAALSQKLLGHRPDIAAARWRADTCLAARRSMGS